MDATACPGGRGDTAAPTAKAASASGYGSGCIRFRPRSRLADPQPGGPTAGLIAQLLPGGERWRGKLPGRLGEALAE
jgi:hypothetical protein